MELSCKETAHTYKRVGEHELKLVVYQPEDLQPQEKRPAILFFFGGGWRTGRIDQFRPQSQYFSSKGLISITVDYRVLSRHQSTPIDSMEDAKSALCWVRRHAEELGIDPERIVASGGSAGGHLAASMAAIPEIRDPSDQNFVPTQLLVLFNPRLDTTEASFANEAFLQIKERALEISPHHQARGKMPDTLIFHGTADALVAYEQSIAFQKRMIELGNECRVIPFEGRGHGFFNTGDDYLQTRSFMEDFLEEKGYFNF